MAMLKRYRIENDIPARRAAKELGISTSTLSRYETGTHFPRPEMLLKIKAWSGNSVTADDMLRKRK